MTPGKVRGLAVCVDVSDSIDHVVRELAARSKEVEYQGLALVIESDGSLAGVVTDGDIRRAYSRDLNFGGPVTDVMTTEPVVVSEEFNEAELPEVVRQQLESVGRKNASFVRHVIVVNSERCPVGIVDFFQYLLGSTSLYKRVAIYGMGYVGLTLAVALANKGHTVEGIDVDCGLLKKLNAGVPHIHEAGLADALRLSLNNGKLKFVSEPTVPKPDVFIIAVGTPLKGNDSVDFSALTSVAESISKLVSRGAQVMLRSTVPVGTSRHVVMPILEQGSSMRAGRDFHLSFAPERTVEGNALHELLNLPQVVGGLTNTCGKRALEFWSTLASAVVEVEKIEAAELVKLANNTFRDVSFAFANELALLAGQYNVDAFKLVKAANDGYPRNRIPSPSPGVGGYCLTKDPLLFSSSYEGRRADAVMGTASRIINERAARFPITIVEQYSSEIGKDFSALKILIIGVAFKGVPETSDMRGSVGLEVANELKTRASQVWVFDNVVPKSSIERAGFSTTLSLGEMINEADAILILNNHPQNILSELFISRSTPKLIFDGWHQMNETDFQNVDGLRYATMGFLQEL